MTNPFLLSSIEDQQPKPAETNPFALQAIQNDQRQDLRNTLTGAVRENPDQAARAAQLAKQYPVPADVLARNLMDVELQAAVDKADATLRTSPKLAQALREKTWLAPQAHDDFPPLAALETNLSQRADRTAMGTLGDVGVVALKGAIGLPQAFVGLADILTGGYAGKGVEATGVRFAEAQKLLDTLYSPAQQQANEAVREADGFISTLGAMLSNPSTIATTVGESAPQMLGGAGIGRGLLAAAPKLAPWLAAAFGEGLMGAGASAEQTRGGTDDGLLSAKQVFAATMSGAGTALFGAVGGRTAQRLGLGDIDTALVARGVDDATAKTLQQGFIARIAGAGVSEGVFEELPQSIQEQLWQNWATDRPLGEGVGKAAAQGLLAGLSMGGGFQAVSEAGATLQRKLVERESAIDRAQTEGQRLTEALQTASQSKLRERNPETFEQLVTAMSEGADGAPQSVFIDAQVLLQSATAEELAQILPSTVEQLQEAATSNGTVEVPVAEALTYLPGTPLEQVFLQNARSAPDAMSLADADQASRQAEQFLAQEADRVLQQAADTSAWQQSSEAVKTTILDQLNSTGRFTSDVNEAYATLQSNFFSTMAARTGLTPQELYDRYSLKVAAQQVGQGGVLNAGTRAVSKGAPVLSPEQQQQLRNGWMNDTVTRTYEGPAQAAIDERGDVGKATAPAAKVMFEVAPDPTDAALTAEWSALSPEERFAISQDVAAKVVPKVLAELGTQGDTTLQLGGYLGATQLQRRVALRVARPELTLPAAKLLGYALAQDSMMVVTETPVVGSEEVGAVTIELPEGFGETQISALYDRLWQLERDGEKLVAGHTTADGHMVILNYTKLSTEELGQAIDEHLGGEFVVAGDTVYSAFPSKEDYGYGIQNEDGASPRQSPAQERPGRLRSEATQLLREALDARRAEAGAAGTYAQGDVNAGRSEPTGDGGAGRPAGRSLAPLEGAPSVPGFNGPDPRVVAVAERYAADNGIDLKRQAEFADVDPERAARIAAAYEAMTHAPNDPAVREAYANLIKQTLAQYQALADAGYQFWFIDTSIPANAEYAGSPWNAMRDMRANQQMGVFPTTDGFGSSEEFNAEDNPLFAETGLMWPVGGLDGELKPVLANDLFRAVHDAFGHGLEGAGFRAQGEENAWQAHVRLFTGSAVAAITSETRGQNSWLNFGPYGESNRTAQVEDTVFADQKTGLMPAWTWTEGLAGDMAEQGVLNQDGPLLAPNGKPSNLSPELHAMVRTPEFKAWFGDWEVHAAAENPVGSLWSDQNVSKAVDENGEPLVMYHGTDTAGFTEFETPGGTGRGDLGIFMTPNREMARTYVKRGRGRELERDQVIAANEDGDKLSGLYPVFANIRNPLESDFEGANWNGERFGQFVVEDENGEQLYTADGRSHLTEDEAQALAEETGGTVEPAPDHYETTDSVVREARDGNDGAIIRNVTDDGGGASAYADEPADVFVAFEPNQIKAVDNFGTFDAQDPNMYKQGPRGTFNPQDLLITLNENADLSTFLHESGHFFLEVMADLASQPNAPQQIQDDMAQVLKWFGVPDLATWNGYTLDQKRPYHERWAESFEQYLFEGKAPSPELQPLFRRFRSWLVNVYKSLTQFMRARDLKLNDEVRQVFARLVATDEQIAQAEEAAGMLPDFEATNEAIEQLQARSLRDLKWTVKARGKVLKALEKQTKELRKGVEAEVRAEVEQQPVYRAMRFFTRGELDDQNQTNKQRRILDTTAGGSTKLDLAALKEIYGDGPAAPWRYLSVGKNGLAGKEGLHPDLAADMFGFESGDKLVRAILDAEPIDSVVEGMTDQRMLERHGDLATPEAREAAANEAVHNEARARSLATELKSQAEMLNPRQDTGRTASNDRTITVNAITAAAKQFAENLAARRRLKDLKNAAWQHRSAEARAGKTWQAATAKGDTQAAVQAKRDQVLNNATVKALQDAQVEVRKILEFFKRVTKGNDEKVVERGRDPDVVNAMRAILGAYDVAPKLEKSALAYMETVAKNDPVMYAALQPSVQGAMLNAKPLTEMTMEELRGLNDELRAMWALAKSSRQMEVDGNLIDIEEAADQLLERMGEIGIPDTIPGEKGAITDKQERGIKLQFAKAILSRVEQWSERLDGKFGGPFLRLVFQPVKDAADRYRTDKVAYRQKFTELLKNAAPYLPAGPIEAPELGYTFGNARDSGAAELLHAILHTGNDSNKRKLLLGRGWATQDAEGNVDTTQWDNFIQRMQAEGKLNKAHYDFAQGVWDLLEEMKPLAQETHRKVFGRYFAEVTANEFNTPFGTYRGGYVPAQTDSRLVKDAKLAEGENESMAYAFPAAPSGFTKSRVEYNQPLLLDLRALGQHMDKVLLFSHMQGAVTDVRRLLTNKRVSYALDRIDPGAHSAMLIPWLNRSARQVVETPTMGDRGMSRIFGLARSRAGLALMFANLSNTAQQITGFTMAGVKVKPGLMMQATARFIANPKEMKTTIADSSPYMKDRMLNEVGAMNDAIEQILVNPTLLERGQTWTQRHAYFMQAAVDNTVSPIVWTAAYNQAIEQKMEHNDAVRFADGVIRQTQGTTLPEDISRFESGPGYARLFTQFVSYFNMMANTNATAVKQIADEVGLKKGAGKVLYVAIAGLLAPIWVAEAIAQAFRGGPEDEDKDGWLDDWLMAVFGMGTLRGLTAQVPIVGQAAQLVINRFNDNPADDKFSLSPAVSLIESTVSAPSSVYKAIVEDGNKQKAVRDVAAAATMITGLPIYGVARPIGYLAGVAGGNIEPTGPVDLARGLVTGTASPESKQR